MQTKQTLIIYGGWDGHSPEKNAHIFKDALEANGHTVTLANSFDPLDDGEALLNYDLIIPMWTMGEPSGEQMNHLVAAIRNGVGLAGSHGGMGDAFRGQLDYEWMVGGHFVGHPHVGNYEVRVTPLGQSDSVMAEVPTNFVYNSEQYYMMMDPAVEVLAETTYTYEERDCTMPVVWKRNWGKGRVFYSALGHDMQEFTDHPYVLDLTIKGLLWATRD
ncbi:MULTISPECIES: ThuA domain-containing protein [unclassified Lentimonas]|uniref:ThuA domain-containing protein n=1 Tax=unclassified Lentimonas TaxID=2630993 RepID=UPI00132601E7|nr:MULTISPECIES: ThuA domain-containing protein [unclassified Lentimonas]CAA6692362.1 Mll2313 protein [Lentimonas sp. CC10]CAA6694699.1 Mll2313 protein [Lentimonas sp. CC19]CAA7071444.1 Mll2313 protein [Lentimonas sp. CC11]